MKLQDLKILIAARSQILRTIVRDNLKSAGLFNLRSAETAEKVFNLAQGGKLHLIIADNELPDMSGLELLKRIRQDYKIQNMPFILISSDAEAKFVAQAAEFRVSSYLVKPFATQTLLDKVRRILEQQINPHEGVTDYLEANRLVNEGNLEEALVKYQQALEATNYSMAAVYYQIGVAHEQLKQEDKAEQSYQQAVERSKYYVDALDALGELYFNKDDLERSISSFQKSTDISPLNAARQLKFGRALSEAGEFDRAEKAYRTALENDPRATEATAGLGQALYKQGQVEQAQEYLMQAKEKRPSDEKVYFQLAQIYFDKGHRETAIAHLEKALEINPDFKHALEMLKRVR